MEKNEQIVKIEKNDLVLTFKDIKLEAGKYIITVTEDNLNQVDISISELRGFLKELEDHKDELIKPYKDAIEQIKEQYNTIKNDKTEILNVLKNGIVDFQKKIEDKKKEEVVEIAKNSNTINDITNFDISNLDISNFTINKQPVNTHAVSSLRTTKTYSYIVNSVENIPANFLRIKQGFLKIVIESILKAKKYDYLELDDSKKREFTTYLKSNKINGVELITENSVHFKNNTKTIKK